MTPCSKGHHGNTLLPVLVERFLQTSWLNIYHDEDLLLMGRYATLGGTESTRVRSPPLYIVERHVSSLCFNTVFETSYVQNYIRRKGATSNYVPGVVEN